ncbi:uncharacterized protein LOC115097141 [Rhinatrema bivittatum]|uniref:uncharacterized protein LOC115097141 n=1 Tax=Rhinatrema bivittatum TaxID=194408 RepID=UPI00112840D4|nr:uncharacterized protein LOC115097141 [Rhinatrema bivittatum]
MEKRESSTQMEGGGRQEGDRLKRGGSQKLVVGEDGSKAGSRREYPVGGKVSQAKRVLKAGLSSQTATWHPRAANFSFQEDELMLQKVIEKYDILHGKQSEYASNAVKSEVWRGIASAVSSLGVARRNIEQCRRRYYVICSKLNKKVTLIKQHSRRRQPCPIALTKTETQFRDLMNSYVVPAYLDTSYLEDLHASWVPVSEAKIQGISKEDSLERVERWATEDKQTLTYCHEDPAGATSFQGASFDLNTSLSASPVTPLPSPMLGTSVPEREGILGT